MKFKVWCKNKNEWEEHVCLMSEGGMLFHRNARGTLAPLNPETHIPVFFTGITDKSGREIYEGDVISCGDGNVPTLIKWHEESHSYYAYNLKRKEHHRLDKFFLRYIGEVIGNIYENPELLESGVN